MMICSPCAYSGSYERVLSFNEHPGTIYVYVSYMENGRTHKHSLKRDRQTHENIKRIIKHCLSTPINRIR